jgi:nitrogen fixation protein NifZ
VASRAEFDIGEIVFAREAIVNDGGIPDIASDALLATPGRRGVVVKYGYVEADKETEIYLVRFEDESGNLGPPVGCLADELTQDVEEATKLAAA